MRTRVYLIAAAAILVLPPALTEAASATARSSPTGPANIPSSGVPSSLPTVTTIPNRGGLQRLLLKANELPKYEPQALSSESGDVVTPTGWVLNTDVSPFSFTCPGVSLAHAPSTGYASISYVPQSNGAPEFFEQVSESHSARAEFAELRRSLNHCKAFYITAGLGHLTALSLPAYGDQSSGYLQTITVPKPVPGRLLTGSVLVRKGNYVMLLAYFPSTQTFTAAQLESFVPPALAKVSSSSDR